MLTANPLAAARARFCQSPRTNKALACAYAFVVVITRPFAGPVPARLEQIASPRLGL